jgi:hypothetical protein
MISKNKSRKAFAAAGANCYALLDFDFAYDVNANSSDSNADSSDVDQTNLSVDAAVKDMSESKIVDLQSRLSCLLELSTVRDNKNHYADWVDVPTQAPGSNVRYTLSGMTEYFQHKRWRGVTDPLRNFDRLDFMSTRIRALNALPENIKLLMSSDLTVAKKKILCYRMVTGWLSGDPNCLRDYHPFIGLSSFIENDIVFTNTDHIDAGRLLISNGRVPKSFLIRESAKNFGDGRGHATVFTFTYVSGIAVNSVYNIYNCRCLAVHGVGVYILNSMIGHEFETNISTKNCMKTLTITAILADCVRYGQKVEPAFASIGEMLLKHHTDDVIDLHKIICTSAFSNK